MQSALDSTVSPQQQHPQPPNSAEGHHSNQTLTTSPQKPSVRLCEYLEKRSNSLKRSSSRSKDEQAMVVYRRQVREVLASIDRIVAVFLTVKQKLLEGSLRQKINQSEVQVKHIDQLTAKYFGENAAVGKFAQGCENQQTKKDTTLHDSILTTRRLSEHSISLPENTQPAITQPIAKTLQEMHSKLEVTASTILDKNDTKAASSQRQALRVRFAESENDLKQTIYGRGEHAIGRDTAVIRKMCPAEYRMKHSGLNIDIPRDNLDSVARTKKK